MENKKGEVSMTCFYCKGDMKSGTTTYMEDLGECIVIVKNVPCKKCSQCGEVTFSGAVVAKLKEIIGQLKDTLTEVAIVNYPNTAA